MPVRANSDAGPIEELVVKIGASVHGHEMGEIIQASAIILSTAICFYCNSRADAQFILNRTKRFIEKDLDNHNFAAEEEPIT